MKARRALSAFQLELRACSGRKKKKRKHQSATLIEFRERQSEMKTIKYVHYDSPQWIKTQLIYTHDWTFSRWSFNQNDLSKVICKSSPHYCSTDPDRSCSQEKTIKHLNDSRTIRSKVLWPDGTKPELGLGQRSSPKTMTIKTPERFVPNRC